MQSQLLNQEKHGIQRQHQQHYHKKSKNFHFTSNAIVAFQELNKFANKQQIQSSEQKEKAMKQSYSKLERCTNF